MPQDRNAPQTPRVDYYPPRFVCLTTSSAGTLRVIVAGELDVATVPQLDQALREAEGDAPLVVLDLRRLKFVALSGVRLLLEADARIREAGGRLEIVHAPAALRRILSLTGRANALDFGQGSAAPDSPAATQQPRFA